MTNINQKQKKTGFALLNSVLAVSFFLGGIIFLIATIGITAMLLLPFIIVNAALAVFYGIYRKNGAMKVPVIFCRVTAILMVIVIFGSPIIGMSFSETPFMYKAKRAIFGYGVRSGENMDTFLPKDIPDNCDNYYFRTQLCFVAQDYHPNAYLAFHCDDSCFPEYMAAAERIGEKYEKELTFEQFISEKCNLESIEGLDVEQKAFVIGRYHNIPPHVISMLKDEHRNMLTPSAEVYNNFGPGRCIFDRTTGLMVFWA